MISLEELKLNLTDAKIAFEQMPADQRKQYNWSDWYTEYMTKSGLKTDRDELGALLREADNSYHIEKEQFPWIDYISRYIVSKIS